MPDETEENKVIHLHVETTSDLAANDVLEAALEQDLSSVVIIGYDADGDFSFASSIASGPTVLWLLEQAKTKLLELGES